MYPSSQVDSTHRKTPSLADRFLVIVPAGTIMGGQNMEMAVQTVIFLIKAHMGLIPLYFTSGTSSREENRFNTRLKRIHKP